MNTSNTTEELKIGDNVKYTAYYRTGLNLQGVLSSIDTGYRAYIIIDKDCPGTAIVKGDEVKVLLREGRLEKI